MSLIDILILAIALSVDAAVVSFSYGLIIKKKRLQNASKLAFSTGFGQFIMPIIGWLGTSTVSNYLQHFDHWISFFVFLLLGLNIINEALHPQENQLSEKQLHIKYLCIIGLATSIDACAAGVTLYFMQTPIFTASVIIGVITFAASLVSFNLSRTFPKISTEKLEISSGIILILLGFKVLYEHLWR